MIIAFWIVTVLLAVAMLGAGIVKLVRSREQLRPQMGWVDDFSATHVRLIAAAEVLGAIGLILPPLTGIAPLVAPVAAIGLAVIMIGAISVHARRREPVIPPLVLLLLAAASAVLGFLTLA